MKRILITLAIAAFILTGCTTMKANELSGKTDATITYYEQWLTGAQILTPFFGPYAPAASVCIGTAYSALELYRKGSDSYTAGKLSASDLAALLVQVQESVQKIVALGNQVGIKQ